MALDQHVVKCKLQFVVVVANNKKTFWTRVHFCMQDGEISIRYTKAWTCSQSKAHMILNYNKLQKTYV
jgi:hypothetical protein